MSWLDDAEEFIDKHGKSEEGERKFNLESEKEEISIFLRKEFPNVTNREVTRAIDYALEYSEVTSLTHNELLKIVRVKLED